MSACFEEVRLSLPHIELAAHLYGPEDGVPVLALHGWLDNAASFARLAPKLDGLRIVALDFAGHGHSEHRPAGAGYALWDYAYDVLQVAEQFGWQRFSILGHSMGAMLTAIQQARHASFAAVVLLGFGTRGLPDYLSARARAHSDDAAGAQAHIAELAREQGDDPYPELVITAGNARVVYGGSGPAATGQVSASVALSDVLTRAGLGDEPDVRPGSVAAWAGRRILDETARIDEVARRLGMSSLDRTARFIAWDWHTDS